MYYLNIQIEDLQKYIEGGYLYIPKKEENKKSWGENTSTKDELNKRNKEIKKLPKNIKMGKLQKNWLMNII